MNSTQILIAISIIGAAAVAATGNDGWGWLLFLAFILLLNDS